MKKRILSAFLAVCLLLTLLPAALAADPLRVLDASGGAVAPDADGKYQLTSGSYTVTGDGDAPIVVSGDVELTLHGAVITRPTAEVGKFGPAIDIQRGSAVLTLTGTNRVTGSPGFAGVYVAEGASVTITGTGSLTATGGAYYFDRPKNYCGGAGIGGNGFGVRGDGMEIYRYPNFGTINIAGGTVRAVGGANTEINYGAGAGIGSGGASSQWSLTPVFQGTINISGGTVVATGGQGDQFSETGGGAGIGSGGVTGAIWQPYPNSIEITVSGDAEVTATGESDGAGIGGGANVNGCPVNISGGTVRAFGGQESGGPYGGAGIGGGDNGSAGPIAISGGVVTATAGGAAAGIGGGNRGGADSISIGGTAAVTAYGGTDARGTRGGAGIGAGRSVYPYGFGSIALSGGCVVRAYAGANAQAIGVGTDYVRHNDDTIDDPNKLSIGKDADVWMFNRDTTWGAFWGQNADGTLNGAFVSGDAALVWHTAPQGLLPNVETLSAVSTKDSPHQWRHTADKRVQLLKAGTVEREEVYPDHPFTLGSWATVCAVQAASEGENGNDPPRPVGGVSVNPAAGQTPMLNAKEHLAYIRGYPDGMVKPNGRITRAEVATIFYRLLDPEVRERSRTRQNDFSDVHAGDWFCTAVSTMARLGVVNGYPDGRFAPNEPITRAEFAAICARFDQNAASGAAGYTDIRGHWAAQEIARATELEWVYGYADSTFRPDQSITRAEAMAIVNRVLKRDPGSREDLLDEMDEWADNMDAASWYYLDVQEATNSHDYARRGDTREYWTELFAPPGWAAIER